MERVIEEMTGNEALLEMLDTESAKEMLNWGIAAARSTISKTRELDDFAADLAILPRLKAIRQSMRSIGNWATGKYTDPGKPYPVARQAVAALPDHFWRKAGAAQCQANG
jgi:hypothetical protein